jgi:hypothetical protein
MFPRAEFLKTLEGAIRSSFVHSLLAKGRLLYTHDDTVADLMAGLDEVGERDKEIQLLRAGTSALPPIYKAHKWMVTRGDLDYTALWILYAATPLAQVEVIGAGQLVDREVIPQAMKLNPELFETVYVRMLNARKTRKSVQAALDAADAYIAERCRGMFALLLGHLQEVAEARSATEIEDWFERNYDVTHVTTACEYLADRGLIGKAGAPAKLTRKSNVQVQELAFFHLAEAADAR